MNEHFQSTRRELSQKNQINARRGEKLYRASQSLVISRSIFLQGESFEQNSVFSVLSVLRIYLPQRAQRTQRRKKLIVSRI